MAHRTQITLTDAQYLKLRLESERTGLSLAELVRRSVDRAYGGLSSEDRLRALDESFGAWREAPGEDRGAYLGELRGPGLARAATGRGRAASEPAGLADAGAAPSSSAAAGSERDDAPASPRSGRQP